MFEIWGPLAVGLILLVAGGDLIVRGAVQAAERLGVSPLVIGLTLVGFGTSMPELVTSVQAGLIGSPGIAYGNIVGSNIANILLIAGVSAMIYPVIVGRAALMRDAMVMLAVALAFTLMAQVVPMGRLAGGLFVMVLAGYLWLVIRQERTLPDTETDLTTPRRGRPLAMALGIAFAGLVLVVAGSALLVDGAVALARGIGVAETVIGLTIVAVGTSLPELVTSVVAALKKQGDVAFGNVVGSNIYNLLGIGGTTALIAPSEMPQAISRFDAPVMVGVSLLFLLVSATGLRIGRREGAVLLAGYGAYIWWLWP
ncbi:MAG: sodium:calcium antiporter [Confluentimicrobium sp.]|uniref:Cation:H+ antiporter n=1 Tax=Celeribacter persicus TaxID=1651082 RepID=A0A2T5H0N6_9RHOB|nr:MULTISPECIES: calcium/sodium antiporter [Roseobacteraceae]MBC57234.1 sodium:calcium antiporter [Actibacterium sp.]PTQ65135.1 cation:H+ antiporter [Celeribacter persicus]|tara:strand:+ start:177 stop:1112 length:936 start_codon:yes stop_codon:yes gene_type:complete